MKKIIEQFIWDLGGQPAYSGNTKTMYITDKHKDELPSIKEIILNEFKDDIPFKLQTN